MTFFTFERIFWVAGLAVALVAGAWVGSEKGGEEEPKVVYKERAFEEGDLKTSPFDQLVLWKTPDTVRVREEVCSVPDWYPEREQKSPEPVGQGIADGVGVDLPGYVTMALVGGQPPISFQDGFVQVQAGDPRTGRMMEFRVELPEDTWRGYLDASLLAGMNLIVASGTFDVERKVNIGLLSLGVGGAAGVIHDRAVATPVAKVGYRAKLF